jgi:hypothetical protein
MNSNTASVPSPMTSHRVHRWEAFTILMLILMDLSWIAPAYSLLVGWPIGGSTATAFLVFGAIYLVSSLVANIPKYVDIFIGIIQVALLTILILGLIWAASELIYIEDPMTFTSTLSRYIINLISFSIPLKPELLLTLVVIFIWRRGFSLANCNIGLGLIRRSFRIGSVVLVGIGVFAAIFIYNLPYLESGLFIFTCLQAMGGARFSTVSSMRGSKRVAFKREWVLGLTGMAALVLALSVAFGAFAAGPLSTWLSGFLLVVEGYISSLLKIILAPFINFLGIIFTFLWGLFEPLPEQDPTAIDELGEGLEGPLAEVQKYGIDPEIASLLTTLGTVIGILILVGIVLYAVRRFRKDSGPRALGEEDSISIAGSLSDYLRSMQARARQALEGVARMNPAARLIAAARIRIIYARLLRLSARLGEPRGPAVTPIEYLDSLERVFPASRDELDLITNAYLRIRYGELPETRQQVEEVESAWGVVRRRGRST